MTKRKGSKVRYGEVTYLDGEGEHDVQFTERCVSLFHHVHLQAVREQQRESVANATRVHTCRVVVLQSIIYIHHNTVPRVHTGLLGVLQVYL